MCMSEKSLPEAQPPYLTFTPELEQRLAILPEDVDGVQVRPALEHALKVVFDPERTALGRFVGGSTEAIRTVQDSMIANLEHVHSFGRSANMPREITYPVDYYFQNPGSIVDVMQQRTDKIKDMFMLDQLEQSRYGLPQNTLIETIPVDHPLYSSAVVMADKHTTRGIKISLYDGNSTIGTAEYHISLSYLNKDKAPDIVSEKYPYYIGMKVSSWVAAKETLDDEIALELPEDMAIFLSDVVKTAVTEGLSKEMLSDIEAEARDADNRRRGARKILEGCVDPTEARNRLEQLGIHDDPEEFLK